MKRRSVYLWVAACLLILAACSEETVLTGDKTPGDALVLKPGEREVSLLLNGVSASGAVPATRAEDAISLSGESTIDELVIYSFVNLDNSGASLTESDRWSYTLERKYHYKANAAGNDLILTADGSNYRITIPVLEDDKLRYFKMQVNMGDGSGVTAVAVDAADRTSATRTEGLPLPPLISANADVITTPLPMNGDCYWEEELTGGYTDKTYIFGKDDLKRGMQASLVRKVSRFDINNPANTRFTVTGITMKNVLPLSGSVSGTEPTYTLKASPENATFIPAAFYLPARNGNVASMTITVTGTLAGVETTVEIPCGDLRLTDNTRYVINIVNSGAYNLSASLRIAEWNTAGNEIDAGDLYGTLNAGATAEVEVVRLMDGDMDGIFETETILTGVQALLYGEIDTDTKKVFVTHTVGQQSGNSKYEVFVKLTGTTGDTKPVGISDPDGLLDWTRKTEDTSTGTYTVKVPFAASTTPIVPFTSPRTSVLKVLTHPAGGEEKGEEYTVTKDYITPGTLTDPRAPDVFGAVDIITSNDRWSVDETTKTITLPVLTEYESLKLSEAGLYSGYITAGLGDWLTATYTPGLSDFSNIPSFIAITPVDNFKSDKPRTGELILRQWNGTAVENTTYKIVQPGGNFDASLLSNGGFGVDISPTFNGGELVEGVTYNNKNLRCPQGGLSSNPIAYNICIYSNNSEPIFVEIIQGSSWMSLEAKIIGGRVTPLEGKYAIGLRLAEDGVAGTIRNGKVAVSYRDAATGSLKTEIINVTQGFGR